MNNNPKRPCIGCVYFAVCGETTRTQPCDGRQTKTSKKEATKRGKAQRA